MCASSEYTPLDDVDRADLAQKALQIEGVVEVRELMTGRENIEVTAAAPGSDDVTRIATSLDTMGLEVESEELIRHHYFRPFNHFGTEDVSDDVDATHEL